jgi:hypothetical protein
MKKLICLVALLASAVLLPAQDKSAPTEPKKNIISMYRVFPKAGHDAALRVAIAAHAQKYHTTWKWRVYEVLTGADGGSYQIVEGPDSWTAIDDRGDLGAEHMADYENNVAPHIEKSTPEMYLAYQADLSTVPVGAFSTKALITRASVKPGRGPAVEESLKKWKAVWEKRGVNVVVYSSSYSGAPSYSIVRRLKNGLKDLDTDAMSNKDAFNAIGGPGAWDAINAEMAADIESSSGEIIELKPEMGSK